MKTKSEQGKANRRNGANFELKVRKDLESVGWFVSKWGNNVDLETQKIIIAKSNRFLARTCGFPDFVAFMPKTYQNNTHPKYKVILVECKLNGKLDKTERLKMDLLEKNGLECWTAYLNERKQIEYRKFMELEGPDRVCRKEA